MKLSALILAFALTGCAADAYHAEGVPSASVYQANRACLPAVMQAGEQYPSVVLPGILPTLLVNAPQNEQKRRAMTDAERRCMAQYGWAAN